MRLKPGSYFLILLLLIVGAVIVSSLAMPYYESKLLPLIIGGITFVLMAVELVRELRVQDKPGEEKGEGEERSEGIAGRTGAAVAWVVGAAIGVYLLGFLVAIVVFIFAYMKKQRRGWKASVLTAVITTVLIYGTFQFALGYELYEGFIYNLIVG